MTERLPSWEHAAAKVAERIRGTRTTLKIMLKTRNEAILLKEWYTHHCAIVGPEAIVIADNYSDESDVLQVLSDIAAHSTVFRFAGFHNDLHDHLKFPILYDALRSSSHFYTVLDTDERLVWIEDGRWYADGTIIERVSARAPFHAMAGNLIWNTVASAHRFAFDPSRNDPENLVQWGKPILSSHASVPAGHRCHNIQFPIEMFRSGAGNNLFQLHLANLLPQQRIKSNIAKLVAHGVLKSGVGEVDILSMDIESTAGSNEAAKRFLWEIKSLVRYSRDSIEPGGALPAGVLELKPGGSIEYYDKTQETAFMAFQSSDARLLLAGHAAFTQQPKAVAEIISQTKAALASNSFSEAEKLLHLGSVVAPHTLDEYGHHFFQKELVRLLLKLGEWNRASGSVVQFYGTALPNWYFILSARQLEQAGRTEEAVQFWDEFLRREPGHPEAVTALSKVKKTSGEAGA